MRLTDDERTTFSIFRNVSDLRIQFLCEYRFYLQEEYGQKASRASIEGTRLHSTTVASESNNKEQHQMIPILIIIAAIIIGYLWIFG